MHVTTTGPDDLHERCAAPALQGIEIEDLCAVGLLFLGMELRREIARLHAERARDFVESQLPCGEATPFT